MAIAFVAEEWIDRPPEAVWELLTDWKAAPRWMSGIDALSAAGPTQVGTRLEFLARGKSRPSEITGLVRGEQITLTSVQGPVSAAYTYYCRPEETGTRIVLVAECDVQGPLRLLAAPLRYAIKRADRSQLAALKALAEGP